MSLYVSVCLSVQLYYKTIAVKLHLSVYLFFCLSICLFVCLSNHVLNVKLQPFINPFVCLSFCLSIHVSVLQSVHLSISLSVLSCIHLSVIAQVEHSVLCWFGYVLMLRPWEKTSLNLQEGDKILAIFCQFGLLLKVHCDFLKI